MRIIFFTAIVITNLYPLTYSRYLWAKGQKKQALGVFFITIFSIIIFGMYTFNG